MMRPFITANQVTLMRLALLPIGSWLLYQGQPGQWGALVFMTLVGFTDFIDGYLARLQGPTVLGRLMDPVADKVFIAVTFLPMIQLEWLPWYIVALLFIREFVVTAARTSFERRQVALRSSYLAKMKTWFQMCGGGVLFFYKTIAAPARLNLVTAGLAGVALLCAAIYYAVKRRWWRGALVFFFSASVLLVVQWIGGVSLARGVLGWGILAITIASGGGYLVGLPALRRSDLPRFDRHDLVRIAGAVALPFLAALLMTYSVTPWPIIATVAFEFGLGGLDNLLAHHGLLPGWIGWGARAAAQAVALGAALVFATRGDVGMAYFCSLLAFAVTALATLALFMRHRTVYLATELQEEPACRP